MSNTIHQQRERRDEDALNMRIASFIKQWQPSDERDAYEFNTELIGIVRECYVQAMRPFQRRLESFEANSLRADMLTPIVPRIKP
jgi:hypothetical protein